MKKKKPKKIQKGETEIHREMYAVLREGQISGKLNMRGKHWSYERTKLNNIILAVYKRWFDLCYNQTDRFVAEWLSDKVLAAFENNEISGYCAIQSERSIKKQIRTLVKSGKILFKKDT